MCLDAMCAFRPDFAPTGFKDLSTILATSPSESLGEGRPVMGEDGLEPERGVEGPWDEEAREGEGADFLAVLGSPNDSPTEDNKVGRVKLDAKADMDQAGETGETKEILS